MGKYLLEQVRARYPRGRFALAVSGRAGMIRDLFAAYPWIEVLEVNKKPSLLVRFFARGRQDIVITPYTGGVFGILPKLAARAVAKTLVGYADKSLVSRFVYTHLIPLVGRSRAPRLLECDALEALHISVAEQRPSFAYLPQPELLPRLGLIAGRYVVLHLFSGSDARGLSPDRKQALIEALAAALPDDVRVVLTGSKSERDSLGNRLPSKAIAADTSLQELAALIDSAAGMVSLDTGAAHIAAHLRKPLVVLASCVGVQWWSKDMYGESVPSALFTRPDMCANGHDYTGYAKCLDAIDVDEVARTAYRVCI